MLTPPYACAPFGLQGVASRDIKLENTLLDGSPRQLIKLADFGFSKDANMQSAPTTRLGTPAYLAPEVGLGPCACGGPLAPVADGGWRRAKATKPTPAAAQTTGHHQPTRRHLRRHQSRHLELRRLPVHDGHGGGWPRQGQGQGRAGAGAGAVAPSPRCCQLPAPVPRLAMAPDVPVPPSQGPRAEDGGAHKRDAAARDSGRLCLPSRPGAVERWGRRGREGFCLRHACASAKQMPCAGVYCSSSCAHHGAEVRDLIARILVTDPKSRPTIAELQSHPWFEGA